MPLQVAAIIDHTLLKPDATRDEVSRLCAEAIDCGFKTVCVNPVWVAHASRTLAGSPVGVCAVVAFPLGAATTRVKVAEAAQAIADGAIEVDMVIDIGALKSGDVPAVERDVRAIVEATGVAVKAIIEACLLTNQEKTLASRAVQAAGAAFVKTSTGFSTGGATVDDVALIRRAVGPSMGIKAAGGIRSLTTIESMVAAGATRIGTSSGVTILKDIKKL